MSRYNLIDSRLSLDVNSVVSLKQSWIVRNVTTTECSIWAGKPGELLKTINTAGELAYDEHYLVTSIDISQINENRCLVVFTATAVAKDAIKVLKPYSQKVESDGTTIRKVQLLVKSGGLNQLLPRLGDLIEWCGDAFACDGSEATPMDNQDYLLEVTAKSQSTIELGGIDESIDVDGVSTKSRSYFVSMSSLAEFIGLHPLGGSENWGGESFYLQNIAIEPHGKIGYKVNLLARDIRKRLLSLSRSESFEGKSAEGIRRKIVYTGRFQVPADSLDEFKLLCGNSASSWAANNTIVGSIHTTKKSAVEYEVIMTAEDRNNPDLHSRYRFDRSDLSKRNDVDVRLADFHLSERQCGYMATDSGFVPSPTWKPVECPLVVTKPLPVNYININLRTLLIEETTFNSGSARSNINNLIAKANQNVFTGVVGGHSGNFFAEDVRSEELNDDQGQNWTKITRVCRLAPQGFTWNAKYWKNL